MNYKKLFIALLFIGVEQLVRAEAVYVVVPKQYLREEASLVLYMLDALGNQCIGTCRLSEVFEQRNIVQQDLCIQSPDELVQLSDSIEITNSSQPRDNEVLLHIEFDSDVRVIRILIVKDNLLADDPFNVVSIAVGDDLFVDEVDEFDSFDCLIEGVDSATIKSAAKATENSALNQYALYAKIYCMMQYKYAKRRVQNLTAWLCKRK